jgi:hypothetical protein
MSDMGRATPAGAEVVRELRYEGSFGTYRGE